MLLKSNTNKIKYKNKHLIYERLLGEKNFSYTPKHFSTIAAPEPIKVIF